MKGTVKGTMVQVSNTMARRLVRSGALCSSCRLPVNIHGGYVPCHGAVIEVSAQVARKISQKKLVA